MKNNVFICLTSYQYMLSDLLAREIYNKTRQVSLIVLKYFEVPELKNKDYAFYKTIKRGIWGKVYSILYSKTIFHYFLIIDRMLRKRTSTLYVYNDRDPVSKKSAETAQKQGAEIVLIEEGIGTYFSAGKNKLIGTSIIPDKVLVGFPELYMEEHTSEIQIMKLNYRELFCETNMKCYSPKIGTSFICDFLILGQATSDAEEYRKLEIRVIKMIKCSYPDMKIVIKPHPRDLSPEKYNNEVKDYSIKVLTEELARMPVESIVYSLGVKNIFSLFSSGGITLASMFGDVRVIYGIKIFDMDIGELKEKIEKFISYLDNLYFPKDEEELVKIVKEEI